MEDLYTIQGILDLERERIRGTDERLISEDTARRWARSNIKRRVGVQWLFSRDDYENFKERDKIPGRKKQCL